MLIEESKQQQEASLERLILLYEQIDRCSRQCFVSGTVP
jgi:hypothetical protein